MNNSLFLKRQRSIDKVFCEADITKADNITKKELGTIIKDTFNTKLIHLNTRTYYLLFRCDNNKFTLKTYIHYKKNGNQMNTTIKIHNLISQYLIENNFPNIILPIYNFQSNLNMFNNLVDQCIPPESRNRYSRLINKYKDGQIHNYVTISLIEQLRWERLDKYLPRYLDVQLWKIIIFQVIALLAKIQEKYPTFRNNIYKVSSILVANNPCARTLKYKINGKLYKLPDLGVQIYMHDFTFSNITGVVENDIVKMVWTDQIGIKNKKNKYYDVNHFLNSVQHVIDEHAINITSINKFIERNIPTTSKHVKYRLLDDVEYITPASIIENDILFEDFRVADKINKVATHTDIIIKTT
jgi:hypothetical protein